MATDWVVDASIGVKLVVEEPDSAEVSAFLAGLPPTTRLLAPSLLRYEIGNACMKKKAKDAERLIQALITNLQAIEPIDVAAHFGPLSYYDAAYLALAVEQKAGLLTADDKLRKAARARGIEVGP